MSARPPLEALAASSWSTFGESPLGYAFAFRASDGALRRVDEVSAEGWEQGVTVTREDFGPQVLAVLADNLRRVLRWGGASTCSVYAHSIRVAALARVLSALLGGDEPEQVAAQRLGAAHDLHEGLPGVGDIPGPALRWLRAASPEVDGLHRRAEGLVLTLADLHACSTPRTDAIWKWADHAALAVERAVYFRDAPTWLGAFRPLAYLPHSLLEQVERADVARASGGSDLLRYLCGADLDSGAQYLARAVLGYATPDLLSRIPR